MLKLNKNLMHMAFMATLCLLQACEHRPLAHAGAPNAAIRASVDGQTFALYKATVSAGLTGQLVLTTVQSANNAVSNAMIAMVGLDDTPASRQIQLLVERGLPHFGVAGESPKLNLLAVHAALKAIEPAKRATRIFVYAGDSKPGEHTDPPAGIQVHYVRADGSIWP